MKMTTIVYFWKPLAVCIVFAGLGVAAAKGGNSDSVGATTNTAVRAVLAMPEAVATTNTYIQIRATLCGNEKVAVAFAMNNIGSSDRETDLGCIRILAAVEHETLARYAAKSQSVAGLDDRDRRALGRWGRYVITPAAINLVITSLIDDTSAAEQADVRMVGAPRRFCDVAFNLALDRIQGMPEEVGKAPLGTRDAIDGRNVRITKLRNWWRLNCNSLEWSAVDRRFRVKASQ